MTIKTVKYLPIRTIHKDRIYNDVLDTIKTFMSENKRYGVAYFNKGEYTEVSSIKKSVARTIKNNNLPIESQIINGELYLVRTDMEISEE